MGEIYQPEKNALKNVFCGNSEMATAMQHYDWDNSDLGPVHTWPESLKLAIRLILTSAYPMFVWWGDQMIMFYNDGYSNTLGSRKLSALGQPGKQVWSEIWNDVGPMLESVLQKGETFFEEKHLLYTEKDCTKQETYYTYSYSPVIEEDGTIIGIFCACHEDTLQILSERRLKTITSISSLRTDISVEESRIQVIEALKSNPNDIPFAILYTADDEGLVFDNLTEDAFKNPDKSKENLQDGTVFSLNEVESIAIKPLPEQIRDMLKIPVHGVLPAQIAIIPVSDAGQNVVRGYLIIGLSPVLPFNEDYLSFLTLLSSQLNATVTTIRAFEHERLISRKLIELDKAKTTFFSNVSHEFRTPLTLILGPLEELLRKSDYLPEEDKVSLQIMQRNATRLLKQVNNLLNFSNVEAGRYNARFKATNLAEVTAELAGTIEPIIKQGGLSFTVNCRQLSEPVFIDADMWEMIVINLLSNAFKFTLSGSITIELIEQDKTVELHVADTGAGIPENEIPRLFERFHRIEQKVSRTFEGSGIGLALVAELVKLHNGTIQVFSEIGQGSRFIVSIPKGKQHLPQDKILNASYKGFSQSQLAIQYQLEAETWVISESIKEQSIEESGLLSNKTDNRSKVLLVDDNPDMLAYVRRLLADTYQVITASNGLEALDTLQCYNPDLILSDIMMPLMDGVTLLNKLRNIPEFVSVPVILLSARAGEEDKLYGLNTGADDYLVKPFSARELVTRISASIKNARLRNELKAKEHQLRLEADERKTMLESILDSISDAFYHVSSDFRFIYVNNRALEITHKTREEHIGRHILEVYPYLINSGLYHRILQAQETMQPLSMEYYDEELERWFDCRLYPTRNGSSAYFADITDRKLEEQARLETEKRFREMANVAPVLIWMSDMDMYREFVNDKWLEFTGRTIEDEIGTGWAESVHPDDIKHCMEIRKNAFKSHKAFSMEYRLLNKEGEYRWILDNGVPRLTNDGKLLGFIGACTDITELKWAEALMTKYNSELEERVISRTAELQKANNQLKIEIEEKVRKKQELIRSHEQLHSLTSHLQDLRENERKLIAREIHDELGQALTALKIEILLLYDRISDSRSKYKNVMLESLESMENALDESLVSLRKIISHLRPSLSDDLELVYEIKRLVTDLGKRIGIPITVNAQVNKVELAPNIAIEVYRVIQESVTNILKHAQATSASIKISKNNDKFIFLVADNGIGFDDKVLVEKKSFGILGIKERAQRIGATINIASQQNKGTTVELVVDAALSEMD